MHPKLSLASHNHSDYSSAVKRFSPRRVTFLTMLAAAGSCHALIVRGFDSGIHKRLLNFPKLVYNVTPSPNPNFIENASLLLGIGWPEDPYDWTRQMALVSPRHIVYASHYPLTPTWQIIFAGNDGNQYLYQIESQTPIINNQGQQTDLMLVTLTSPVNTSVGIKPFPILNLPTEADYVGKSLFVCGSFVDAGRSTIAGLTTLVNDPGFDTTRFIYFDYDKRSGGRDDCMLWYGDSGGPSFVMINGQPALVGTNSGLDDLTPFDGIDGPVYRSYLASIPSYMNEVDTLMESKGYHLKRFYPAATTVSTQVAAVGSLKKMQPGNISISIVNSGTAAAHNATVTLSFTSAPTIVTGTGWICEATTPLIWTCRRGGLNAGSTASLNASFAMLPSTPTLGTSAITAFDGASASTTQTAIPLQETYSLWAQGLTNPAPQADPDGDGMSNLLEYAFGGSPQTASATSPSGHRIQPWTSREGDRLELHFARRTDASARGIEFTPEYAGPGLNWSEVLPVGSTTLSAPFVPPSAGFEEVKVSVPITAGSGFLRVKVRLQE